MAQYRSEKGEFIPEFRAKELKKTIKNLLSEVKPHIVEISNKTAQDAIDRTVLFLESSGYNTEENIENFGYSTMGAVDYLFHGFMVYFKKESNGKRMKEAPPLLLSEAQVIIISSLVYVLEKYKNVSYDYEKKDFDRVVLSFCNDIKQTFKEAITISKAFVKDIRREFFCILRTKEINDGKRIVNVDDKYNAIEQYIKNKSSMELDCLYEDAWPLIEWMIKKKYRIDYEITSIELNMQQLLDIIKPMDYCDKMLLLEPLGEKLSDIFSWLKSCAKNGRYLHPPTNYPEQTIRDYEKTLGELGVKFDEDFFA